MSRGGAVEPSLAQALYAALADGRLHSGAELARTFQVTRAGVWKALQSLRELGLEFAATPNSGYQLPAPIVPLAAASLLQHVSATRRGRIASCSHVWSTASTNQDLLEAPSAEPGQFRVLLAEHQQAGRGRRGRHWQAPLGGALCMSLGFAVAELPANFAALTLVMGLAVRAALLESVGVAIQLKWPNDLLIGERKLGGILAELRAEAGGPAWVVVGIGINVRLGATHVTALRAAGADPIDLATGAAAPERTVDRNALAAAILTNSMQHVEQFLQQGLTPFATRWHEADALWQREVVVSSAAGEQHGMASGIDAQGALLLQGPRGTRPIIAGEVSVRPRK